MNHTPLQLIESHLQIYLKEYFFLLFQNFYDTKGNHLAHLDLAFGLMDTKTRKLTSMPNASFEILKSAAKSESFKILTKEDMRKQGKFPENNI